MAAVISVDLEPQVKKFLHSSLIHACGNVGIKSDGVVDTLLRCLATPPSITTLRFNTLKYTIDDIISSIKPMIDEVFDERGALPPQINQHPVINDIIIVPGIGPQRAITPEGKKIIVGLLCGLAVMRGAQAFAPGVMGAPKSLSKGDLVCVFADIEGKCCKGLTTFYDGHTFFVGNGIAMQNRSDWFGIDASNSGVAVKMTQPLYIAPCLDIKNELCDMLYPQNLPSIVVSHVLSPAPGEIVLDMCASPGGKTTHIATLMKNTGCVIAIDKTPSKIVKLKENVAKFCCSIVQCFLFDSTVLISNDIQFIINPEAPSHPPYPPETFDKVLLDTPCSGLGQRPQLKYSLKLSEYCSYQVYQRKLIKQAVNSLKKGGILVYSTCTISPDENESQVYWILKTFPDLQLSEQSPIVGYPALPGYGLNMEQCSKLQRFGPYEFFKSLSVDPLCDNVCDTIGFFIAKFIKI